MLAVVMLGLTGVHAAPGADPQATMRRLAVELDLQTRMPDHELKRPEPPSADIRLNIPGAQAILWGAIALSVVFASWALRDYLPGFSRRSRQKAPDAAEAAVAVAAARMMQSGDDADDLAISGHIAEAMHMLLLRSLIEVRRLLAVELASSLTSREILARLDLSSEGREALGDLVGRVEFVHFGAKPAAPDDYAACRISYERLIKALLDDAAAGRDATSTSMAA